MATLVLTAVGTAVGGPIGGALGAILGQSIDSQLFKPKGRQGPRLGELAVQTSSYGTAIPKLFGSMRVAGTVIWSTDLKEDRTTSGGGKGNPKTSSYSYSASFAVALSGRPIRSVKRIWADGKLLRGAAGDLKSAANYRLYLGTEEQEPDPLIASVEGITVTPAFRGIAYAMFEDLQLADYGNHIPSLTFEVEADEGPVTIGFVAEILSAGAVRDGATPAVVGYAASGDSVRGAVESLGDVVPLCFVETEAGLVMMPPTDSHRVIEKSQTGAAAAGAGGTGEMRRQAAGTIPAEVGIVYYDPGRDYQTGFQRASRGGPAIRSDQRSLPAALNAETAKGFAEHRLAALWAGRVSARLHLPWRLSGIRPGGRVLIEGQMGLWRVERWSLDRMVTSLDLVREASPAPAAHPAANPGRPVGSPDLPYGATTLVLLDMPLAGDRIPDHPHLLAAAAGQEAGWRRAGLTASYDGGSSWQPVGSTAAPAVIGYAATKLGAGGGSALIDTRSSVDVELLSEAMWLEGRSDPALAGGANLAAIGQELIQFGLVQPLGGRRFRLSRLLRGRRGTEWAGAGHAAGETFVLIEQDSLAVVEPPVGTLGGEAMLVASGIGDTQQGSTATITIGGEALRPPAPVHLRASRVANGDIVISWVRRSRSGWAWLSGSDTPLGEEIESYRIVLSDENSERILTVPQPVLIYSAAQRAADGLAGPFTIRVAQMGTFSPSREAQVITNESGETI